MHVPPLAQLEATTEPKGTSVTTLPAVETLPCPCCRAVPGAASGWHRNKGPLPLLQVHHGLGRYSIPANWIDHAYRVRRPSVPGGWLYFAEPYHLDPEALDDLAWLSEQGWAVWVTASGARHFPGWTVVVELRPR